jgi:GNAT superfamily N-acetyltransferase
MPDLIELDAADDTGRIRPGALMTPLSAAQLRAHAPDRSLALVDADGRLLARASCWWSGTPSLPGHRVGLIGHYGADDDESAQTILQAACARLSARGCTCVVGPMDGSTWRSYRLVVDPGTAPPFFLEPVNPPSFPAHFGKAGFSVMATYSSALADDLTRVDPRVPAAEDRLRAGGVVIRSLRLDEAERDLRRIFALSLESFARNFLYTPIGEAEFLEQNRQILPVVHPDLVLLAERNDALVGFLFAVPDVLRTPPESAIIKTVAVSPALARSGLGSVLVATAHQRAHQLGFRRAIHALMHERNVSQNISRRFATTMRRYALFVKALGGGEAAP